MTTRQIEREQNVFAACRRLLGELGEEGLTIRHLASESGVSVATLYNRYGTRNALIARVMLDEFQTRIEPRLNLATSGIAPLEQLVGNLSIMVRETRRTKAFSRALLGAYFGINNDREMPKQLHQAVLRTLSLSINRMSEGRQLRSWVDYHVLSEEITNRFFDVSIRWAQGVISGIAYESHVHRSVLMSLAAVSHRSQTNTAVKMLEALFPQ